MTSFADASDVFKDWAGKKEIISLQTANKTLTLLRHLSRERTNILEVTHLLNIVYTLAEEFKAVYKRIE